MNINGENNPNWKGGISKNKKEYQHKWFQDNKEKNRERSRLWYQNHNERGREINIKSRLKIRMEILRYYGGNPPKCACCGEAEIKFLAIDHMKGGGKKHLAKIGGGGANFYFWLKKNKYPKDFQVLCHNCNFAKGHYGHCPHKDI